MKRPSGCPPAQATDVCQRIRQAVVSAPVSTPHATLSISLSMGVWITDPRTPITPADAIGNADAALYQAKRSGQTHLVVRQ